ncbi:MAG: hypothetical protein RSA51_03460 [Niameybacter sp.]
MLQAKTFCICTCADLQALLTAFLAEIQRPEVCIQIDSITTVGCACACRKQLVVLFYRVLANECPPTPIVP